MTMAGAPAFSAAVDRLEDPRTDRRVDDRLEVAERLRIREDDPAEACSIERSVVPAEVGSEPGDDGIERRLTGLHDVARDLVGVDDDDTGSFAEPARDRRLAAADGSGQPDAEHRPGR